MYPFDAHPCDLCGQEPEQPEDLEWIPTPSLLDPEAETWMCRECARDRDLERYFVDPVYTDKTHEAVEELDPLYLEEILDRE